MAEGFSRQLSAQRSIDSADGVSLELELLRNVYMKDLHLTKDHSGRVEMLFHVTPSTGENLHEKYTYLNLHLAMPEQYPEEPVQITTPVSRGIADAHLMDILTALKEKASDLIGGPMIFELVEYAKDSLTDNNLPCGECVVCLLPFHDGEGVTRTDCYHYFHTSCLTRYTSFFKREQEASDVSNAIPAGALLDTDFSDETKKLECPVCREPIAPDAACLAAVQQFIASQQFMEGDCSGGHQSEGSSILITEEIRHWQQEMASLLERQREKGGLINVHAKDEVIDESWVRPVATDTPHTSTNAIPCVTNATDTPHTSTNAIPCVTNIPPISTGEPCDWHHDDGVTSNNGWPTASRQRALRGQRGGAIGMEDGGGNMLDHESGLMGREENWRGAGEGREKGGRNSGREENWRGTGRGGGNRQDIGEKYHQSRPMGKRREKGWRKGNGRGLTGGERDSQDIGETGQMGRGEGWRGSLAGGERQEGLRGRREECYRRDTESGRQEGLKANVDMEDRRQGELGGRRREDRIKGSDRTYQQKRTCNNNEEHSSSLGQSSSQT